VTHDARLQGVQAPLQRFAGEAGALGAKWAVALVQLPPSLALHEALATEFFARLAEACPAAVVCEPRHASWFTPAAAALLARLGVARAGVDPAKWPGSALPLPAPGRPLHYYRWHGSPRLYRSPYEPGWLAERAAELAALPPDAEAWCIFDNTAGGAALDNALDLQARR
jgi:uncharacterized protein YecE (DUF72 family)